MRTLWKGAKSMSRAEKAGRAMGESLIEMVHLMYQNNTAANFWRGLMDVLKTNERKRNEVKP